METTRSLVRELTLKYDINNIIRIVDACTDYLDIKDVDIYISPMRKGFEDDYFAFIQQASETMFVVYIKESILKKNKINRFNVKMLLHEMVHLRQYVDKHLSVPTTNSSFAIWKGKRYDSSFEYNQRPWEMEAEHISKKGYRGILKELKK